MGVKAHPLYELWRGMVRRCHDPKATGYKNYGGRGIVVCPRWRYDFKAFVDDLPPRPSPLHEIDREENDGNYEPGNVKWSTAKEQANNRRSNVLITANGKTQTAASWASELGISIHTILGRIARGWISERVVVADVQRRLSPAQRLPEGGVERCAREGIDPKAVSTRMRLMGWTFEKAVSTPLTPRPYRRGVPVRNKHNVVACDWADYREGGE